MEKIILPKLEQNVSRSKRDSTKKKLPEKPIMNLDSLKLAINAKSHNLIDHQYNIIHFKTVLGQLLPNDLTLGERHTVINKNIFTNDYMFETMKKIYRKNHLKMLTGQFSYKDQIDEEGELRSTHPNRFYRKIEIRDEYIDANLDYLWSKDVHKA